MMNSILYIHTGVISFTAAYIGCVTASKDFFSLTALVCATLTACVFLLMLFILVKLEDRYYKNKDEVSE